MKRIHTTIAIAAMGLAASAAFANDIPAAPLAKTVSFAQLDMSQPAASEHLYQKLKATAKQVCEPANGTLVSQKAAYRACISDTLANAVQAVNKPQLTNVYAAHHGGLPTLRVATK